MIRSRWKLAVSVLLALVGACGTSSAPAGQPPPAPAVGAVAPVPVVPPPPAAPAFPLARGGGHFVAWHQSTKAIYRSDDGHTWTRLPGEAALQYGWTPWLAADAAGTLFTTSLGSRPDLQRSTDGLAWTAVPTTTPEGERASFALCAGPANELFTITSTGQTFRTTDGGATWTEAARARPVGARGSGGGFGGSCAYNAAGDKLVVQGWYFDPQGPVLAVSSDHGQTWTNVPPPMPRNEATAVMWADNALLFGNYEKVYRTEDNGVTWTESTPSPLYATGATSHGYNRWYASDGASIVVGIEAPSTTLSGALFYSHDGGRTFETLPLDYHTDPTPQASDDTIRVTFVPHA